MRRRFGFTLIEVMVVVLIIAIISGLALAYSGPNPRDEMLREVSQFATTLEDAHNEAISRTVFSSSRVYNLVFRFKSNAYQWCVYSCSYQGSTLYPKSQIFNFDKVKIAYYKFYPHIEGARVGARASVGTSWKYFYYRSDGSCGSYSSYNFPTGITFYLQHKVDPSVKYRVVVMPLTGKTKIIEGWQ